MDNLFCLKCKQFTDNLNEHVTETSNNKPIVKAKCSTCGSNKCRFIKESKDSSKKSLKNKHGKGIIDMLPEMHMSTDGPGEFVEGGEFNNTGKYSYCGPGTKLEKRLKQGYKGVNVLDQACLQHDLAYNKYKDVEKRNLADNELARASNVIANDSNLNPKIRNDAKKVAAVMGVKSYFGLGGQSGEL